jgi:hypothetical protein
MRRIEARVRDRSGLPDHIAPTTPPRRAFHLRDRAVITGAVSSWPEAKDLLRGKTFVRYVH